MSFEFCGNHLVKATSCLNMAKTIPIKKLFSQFDGEELDWPAENPDLIPIQHLCCADCEPGIIAKQCFTKSLVAIEQISAARFQNLVDRHPGSSSRSHSSSKIHPS